MSEAVIFFKDLPATFPEKDMYRKPSTPVILMTAYSVQGLIEEARSEIRKLGLRVEADRLEAQDVTKDYADREARLRNLRAQEAQYLGILKQADSIVQPRGIRNENRLSQKLCQAECLRVMQIRHQVLTVQNADNIVEIATIDRESRVARAFDNTGTAETLISAPSSEPAHISNRCPINP